MPPIVIPDAVRRIFTETFKARDVAEPLASFDADADADAVRAFMAARDFDIVGVRDGGLVVGFVERSALQGGVCGQWLRALDQAAVVDDTISLVAVVTHLNGAPFAFVRALGGVSGIVTTADLQKPPVRMWLFGIVTLIEMRCAELIERHLPNDAWKEYVSAGRLEKAQALLDERSRRNQALRLLDCLQFSDKGQIIARCERIREFTAFPSRSRAEEATKRLEQLRNNLAHAQDVLATDWDTIVRLCEFITAP